MIALLSLLAALAPAAADDIRDIRGPVIVPASPSYGLYVIGALALLAIGVIATLVIRRRRRAVPADVAALRALEAARTDIDQGDPRTFSTRVSAAIRQYVELAFGVQAPRRTTEELLADLMTDASPVAGHRQELGAFLEYCDLAKYARRSLSREQMTGMLDTAASFVRATSGART